MTANDRSRIIGLGYKFGCGKDHAAEILVREAGYMRVSFGDIVRETCRAAFGFTREQLYTRAKHEVDPFWGVTPARMLQLVGSELFRIALPRHVPEIGPGVWARGVEKAMLDHWANTPEQRFVITDVRFENEAETVKRLGGFLVRVDCELEERQRRTGDYERDPNHMSETSLDGFTGWDLIIDNNGPEADFDEAVRLALSMAEGRAIEPGPPEVLPGVVR